MQPADDLGIYEFTSGTDADGKPLSLTYSGREWFTEPLGLPDATRPVRMLAKNIIALVILPKLSANEDPSQSQLAPNFAYDSTNTNADPKINPKNQLPPVLQITMVAIDEASAARLSDADNAAIQSKVSSLFRVAAEFEDDLVADPSGGGESLEDFLSSKNISYRVFTTNVSIAGAKWSAEQVN